MVDFHKGEREYFNVARGPCLIIFLFSQMNMDYCLSEALKFNSEGIPRSIWLYDIMCQFWKNLKKRFREIHIRACLKVWRSFVALAFSMCMGTRTDVMASLPLPSFPVQAWLMGKFWRPCGLYSMEFQTASEVNPQPIEGRPSMTI